MEPSKKAPGSELPSGIYRMLWSIFSLKSLLTILRMLWLLVNNLYVIPTYFVYMFVLCPLLLFKPKLFWQIEAKLFTWMQSMVACWLQTAGYKIYESGPRLDPILRKQVLFMPNHQSTGDVPLCIALFAARGFSHNVMWIMDSIFRYTHFGCVSWLRGDFFIRGGKKTREKSLVELCSHIRNVFLPLNRRLIVIFPEGGFLRKRKPVSQAFALKNNLPHLEYCTTPRTGALETVIEVLGRDTSNGYSHYDESLKHKELRGNKYEELSEKHASQQLSKIVDVTIAYPEGNPLNIRSITTGSRGECITHVHYRIFDMKSLPSNPVDIRHWMYNLYAEKDKLLEEYYQTGQFPYEKFRGTDCSAPAITEAPRELIHDTWHYFWLHVFYIGSTAIAWKLLVSLWSVIV